MMLCYVFFLLQRTALLFVLFLLQRTALLFVLRRCGIWTILILLCCVKAGDPKLRF